MYANVDLSLNGIVAQPEEVDTSDWLIYSTAKEAYVLVPSQTTDL